MSKETKSRTTKKKTSTVPKVRKKETGKKKAPKSKSSSPTLDDFYRHADDPDWFSRLCSACKSDKKADKSALLVNVQYESTAMPLYRAYRGVVDPSSLFLPHWKETGEVSLPASVAHKIAIHYQSLMPKTLVLEIGSSCVKAGWSGDYNPSLVFPTLVGQTNWQPTPVGYDALPFRKCIDISYPVREGGEISLTDWSCIETIVSYVIQKLGVVPEETSILVALPTLNYYDHTTKAISSNFISLIFEKYSFASASFCTRESLALYASGRTTGTVVHIGHKTSIVVPVYEGCALMDTAQSSSCNGSKLTENLSVMLAQKDIHLDGFVEQNVVRDMKEKHCFIRTQVPQYDGRTCTYTPPFFVPSSVTLSTDYTLGDECWKCPEKLFESTEREQGLHHTLYSSLYLATAAHPELLSTFFGNIVLSGGSTKFSGFEERLQQEVSGLLPSDLGVRASVYGHPARQTAVWRGGSMRACIVGPSFSAEQYNELGPLRALWTHLC